GLDRCRGVYAGMTRGGHYGKRVQLVVLAEELPADTAHGLALPRDLESTFGVERPGLPRARRGEPFHGRPDPLGEYSLQASSLPLTMTRPARGTVLTK